MSFNQYSHNEDGIHIDAQPYFTLFVKVDGLVQLHVPIPFSLKGNLEGMKNWVESLCQDDEAMMANVENYATGVEFDQCHFNCEKIELHTR